MDICHIAIAITARLGEPGKIGRARLLTLEFKSEINTVPGFSRKLFFFTVFLELVNRYYTHVEVCHVFILSWLILISTN